MVGAGSGLRLGVAALALVLVAPLAAAKQPQHLRFQSECAAGDRVQVLAVGDLLFHKRLQLQAYEKGRDFTRFFTPVAGLIAAADIAYGNLEGPAARGVAGFGREARDPGRVLDGRVYAADLATLNFNFHPSVVADLKRVGFDVLSLANNHILDRGALGVDRTIEAFEAEGLPQTGARHRSNLTGPWHAITTAKGITLAWLACTYSTNGFADKAGQVLFCHDNRDQVLAEITRLAADPSIDGVIVTPHWGAEDSHTPLGGDKALARAMIDAGALAVVGAHPHVVQPWEKHVTADGRDGLIVYSTGNFISNQRQLMQRAGVMVSLEIVKPALGLASPATPAKAQLAGVGFLPTWVEIDGKGHRVHPNPGRGWPGDALRHTLRLLPAGNVRELAQLYAAACKPDHIAGAITP